MSLDVSQSDLEAISEALVTITSDVATGNYIAAAENAFDIALKLIPVDQQSTFLTAAAIRRQQALKDAADAAKFGSGG